jgi:uncharacterized protein YecE (DUF72 family)
VLFQLAPWVKRSEEAMANLGTLPRELPGSVVAIEFRNRSWFGEHTNETLQFLAQRHLTYVSIDAPRSVQASHRCQRSRRRPRSSASTGGTSRAFLKQLQGREAPTVAEKCDYLYNEEELEEIAHAAGALNGRAERVHLAMNNNRGDYPAINGLQLKEMLLENWHAPDRRALVEELDERRARAKRKRQAHRAA